MFLNRCDTNIISSFAFHEATREKSKESLDELCKVVNSIDNDEAYL